MTKRDGVLLASLFLVIGALFAPLIGRPWLIPGNFGDLYSYHYPMRHLVASRVQQGELPLWNPYIFTGVPLAANPQALLLYPPAQLHYFLPLSWAFSLDACFHVCLAALGAWLLLRAWRLDAGGAATLAAAYALSPFLIYRVSQGVPTHLAALAWVPWIWLAAVSRYPLLVAPTLALQILSGHPQFALINAIGLGVWTLLVRPRGALGLAPAAILGLFLAAAQVGPTLEYLHYSVRAHWDASFSSGYSLQPRHLLTLLWPRAFGTPLDARYDGFPSEFFEMLGLYLGWIPLALAALGAARARSRPAACAGLLLALGAALALGVNDPAYPWLQSHLHLDFLRVPARFSFLILWGVWLFAALGWARDARRRAPAFKAALALLTVLDLGLLASRWLYAQDPAAYLAPQPEVARLLRRGPRIATAPELTEPNKTMLYRIRNATGYEAFYPALIALYTARSEGEPAADGSRTRIRRWRAKPMEWLGVRYYLTHAPEPGETPALVNGSTLIYENPVVSPLVGGADAAAELRAERLVARMRANAEFVLHQAYYPGWRAYAQGAERETKLRAGLFPVVAAPGAEPWTCYFQFRPGSWTLGLIATFVTLYLILGIAELRLRAWMS